MSNDIWEQLAAPFPFSEIEIKTQSVSEQKGSALAVCYLDARAVRRRLNTVLGRGNWGAEYRPSDKGVICRLSVAINDAWETMEDGAGYTDIEAFKGGISDAFKRAFSALCNDSLYDTDLGWQKCEFFTAKDGKQRFSGWTKEALKDMEAKYNRQVNLRKATAPPKAKERTGELREDAPFGWSPGLIDMAIYSEEWALKLPTDAQFKKWTDLCVSQGFSMEERPQFQAQLIKAYGLPKEGYGKAGGVSFAIDFLCNAGDTAIDLALKEAQGVLAKRAAPGETK